MPTLKLEIVCPPLVTAMGPPFEHPRVSDGRQTSPLGTPGNSDPLMARARGSGCESTGSIWHPRFVFSMPYNSDTGEFGTFAGKCTPLRALTVREESGA